MFAERDFRRPPVNHPAALASEYGGGRETAPIPANESAARPSIPVARSESR